MLLVFTIALVVMMFVRLKGAYVSGEATFDLRLPLWPFMALIWTATVSPATISARVIMLVQGGGLDSFEGIDLAEQAKNDDRR